MYTIVTRVYKARPVSSPLSKANNKGAGTVQWKIFACLRFYQRGWPYWVPVHGHLRLKLIVVSLL